MLAGACSSGSHQHAHGKSREVFPATNEHVHALSMKPEKLHDDSVSVSTPTCRRLPAYFDLPPAIGFGLSLHTSSLRGCHTNLDRVSSAGLVFSTAHRLILIAALKALFTNAMLAIPLVERTNARIPRTCAFCATRVPSSSHRTTNFPRLSPLFLVFFFFFTTCSSSLAGWREEDVSVSLPTPG